MLGVFGNIFKKKKKIPKTIQVALDEYRELMLEGCLRVPCNSCRHFRRIDEHRSTCKREMLVSILLTNYRDEMNKIDDEIRQNRGKAV